MSSDNSVNLNSLTEVATVGTNDNFLLFNESSNVATRIDYDALADAILEKMTTKSFSGIGNKNVITAIKDMQYTPLFSQTYSNRAEVLAALDVKGDSVGNGSRMCGYFNTATSNLLGLSNTSHYFDFYINSDNYRLLVCRPLNGQGLLHLVKTNGTWSDRWIDSLLTWPTETYVKITTSLETFAQGHSNGTFYAWSAAANATTVGAPSEHSYHYIITKTNSSTIIITAVRMVQSSNAQIYIKQLYGGNWGTWYSRPPLLDQSGGNITADNINDLTTPAVYSRYIEASTITGATAAGTAFGLFIVTNAPNAERIGQYIFMPHTGYMAFRYYNGTTWTSWRGMQMPVLS